jgi:hypothetical protein
MQHRQTGSGAIPLGRSLPNCTPTRSQSLELRWLSMQLSNATANRQLLSSFIVSRSAPPYIPLGGAIMTVGIVLIAAF